MIKKILYLSIIFFMASQYLLRSGSPFITDDPDVIAHKHSEIYFGSTGTKSNYEFFGFLPSFEFNYGLLKDTQLHVIMPLAIDKKIGQPAMYGPGMVELGIKYRFIHESDNIPQIGTYPLIDFATADVDQGLGNSKTQIFLPIWIQKTWGQEGQNWVLSGGGGYWINPGDRNRDSWLFGCLLQHDVTKSAKLGIETFFHTKRTIDERESFGINIGGSFKFKKDWQLLYSFG